MYNFLGESGEYLQSSYTLADREFKQVHSRLDALLMVLKSCYGKECHEPWKTLHPKSKVKNIKQALEHDYDDFYENQPKVSFSSCELGYLKDAEGPQHVNAWTGEEEYPLASEESAEGKQKSFQYHGPLEWWT